MAENQVFEYSLSSGEKEQVLRMKVTKEYLIFIIEYQTGQIFTAYVKGEQLKDVCKAFINTKTLNEMAMILHNTIEAGNISLTEDEKGSSIELKFAVKLASGNYPAFSIILELENIGQKEVKSNQKEANKKAENKGQEGTGESKFSLKTVPAKNTKNKEKKNNKTAKKNAKEEVNQSKYTTFSVPTKNLTYSDQTFANNYQYTNYTQNNNIIEYSPNIINQNDYQYQGNNTYTYVQPTDYNQLINQNNTYTYNTDYSTNYSNYPNYSNYTDYSNYSNYQSGDTYQTGYYTQTQNSYDLNQLYQNQDQYQNYSYQPSTYQYQNNVYSSTSYTQPFSNQFEAAFAEVIPLNPIQEFLQSQGKEEPKKAEPNQKTGKKGEKTEKKEKLKKKEKVEKEEKEEKEKLEKEKEVKEEKKEIKDEKDEREEKEVKEEKKVEEKEKVEGKEKEKEKEEEEEKEKKEEKEQENQEEKEEKEKEKQGDNEENEEEEEYEEVEEYEEIEEVEEENEANDDNEENKEENREVENKGETEGGEEQTAQNPENDIETLYRTEDGLIIFRNGILKGIINKYAEIDNVVTKIQDIIAKGAKFTLLYKATTHGDKASVFHEKCDSHQMTLILIETNKGIRFGGFTTQSWDGHCKKKNDNDAFVFSIDTNKIFEIVPDEPAIGCYPKFGPVFFGCQIRIYDNFFTKGGSTCYSGLNYKTTKDFELNNGEQTFIVKDIEVYDIEGIDI